jgi:UDP:flavonoid glycosyltransferase YjiC (YdhE family)
MWKEGFGHEAVARSALFTVIVEPGEYAHDFDRGITAERRYESVAVSPVTFARSDDLLDRDEARVRLGLDPDRPAALLQLGAGQINDVSSLSGRVLEALRRDPEVQVVMAESVLTRVPAPLPEGVTRVREFPVSAFFPAFDLAFMASGYNSFHEALSLELPTMFIPNLSTKLDDQGARASYAAASHTGVVWDGHDEAALDRGLQALIDPVGRELFRANMAKLHQASGAAETARVIRQWETLP